MKTLAIFSVIVTSVFAQQVYADVSNPIKITYDVTDGSKFFLVHNSLNRVIQQGKIIDINDLDVTLPYCRASDDAFPRSGEGSLSFESTSGNNSSFKATLAVMDGSLPKFIYCNDYQQALTLTDIQSALQGLVTLKQVN